MQNIQNMCIMHNITNMSWYEEYIEYAEYEQYSKIWIIWNPPIFIFQNMTNMQQYDPPFICKII